MNNINNRSKLPYTIMDARKDGQAFPLTQDALIYQYNIESRDRFNPDLFVRDDDDIIDELINVIKMCQRKELFTIWLNSWEVVDDPMRINQILRDFEQESKSEKNKNEDNVYDFIPLNDTDVRLLIVTYFIEIDGESDMYTVPIVVPKVVNGNAFRLAGKLYTPMYQITDTSTYNHTAKNYIGMMTIFGNAKIYRKEKQLKTINHGMVKGFNYTATIFGKKPNAYIFLLAKFGLLDTLDMMGLEEIYFYDSYDASMASDDDYVFNKGDIYIVVPKMIFDKDHTTQSFIHGIMYYITKNTKFREIFLNDFWAGCLGKEFGQRSRKRADIILESFEGLYDLSTMDSIPLPMEEKGNIFLLWRWMLRDFSALMVKNNRDIRFKKIKYSEYIAAHYAVKVSNGIHRISDTNRVTLKDLRNALYTHPLIIIKGISKSSLRMFKDLSNDLDSLDPIKYTFKREIVSSNRRGRNDGNSKKTSTGRPERAIYPEYIGKLDLDTSSSSDPGLTGVFCPHMKLKENGSFIDAYEPLEWETNYKELLENYRDITERKQVLELSSKLTGSRQKEKQLEILNAGLSIINSLIEPISILSDYDENGLIIPMVIL